MFIATLIAAESITAGEISAAADRLDTAGCQVEGWTWIDEGRAADIRFASDVAAARPALEGVFDRIDIAVQPGANREKALLVADMDSTMITVECIDELADYAGIKPQIAEVTERAMRGELDFASALDARVALLEGLEEAAIQRCLDERVKLMPGAKTLIRTMRARGATTILVSGGFTRFAEPVGHELGFHRMIANRLLIEDGKLTGKVRKPIVDATTKEVTLLAAIDELRIDPAATLAVGDGANDLPMIRRAGLGVAYHAKPIVAAEAGVRIDHNDLTALLYIQGIAPAEWTAG
ncbi:MULTISPECIES: phosphoserine phosphatase SerB [unclassified Sphingomonas]|uniref:phosphoserine phosphatase SerB n=1 Tax=unclassified Sphingomonas TaxID=196159 RepID=UPI0006F8F976|nr:MULTISPECIES: phosphoserine phosphatase SerB [unclassified Sphingomonas]KQM66956.1 phosphoserine phosphatase [Sphingomonas sp. Leaf16]KQN17902.1 phosphoserine phosphatase [Sphingomonas sp. Leaf29]KQN23766.1 phosphoserine phosphatase [Sphingomonas sp. Leaf32]